MPGIDKSGAAVQEMFGAVAPRYDLLNHLLSGGLDLVWRRRAAAAVGAADGHLILDLCCGTGDQAIALGRRGADVVAADFCVPMLARAQPKYQRHGRRRRGPQPLGIAGDALALPLPSGRFDGLTISFGLRNVADLDAALNEMARVLKPGGRMAILEFALPTSRLLRAAYLFYFRHLLPRIGRLLSDRGSAYTYLPLSVLEFPQRDELGSRLEAAGFGRLAWRNLTAGIVVLYLGEKLA